MGVFVATSGYRQLRTALGQDRLRPYLHLVEPGGMGRRVMQIAPAGSCGGPATASCIGLMNAQVVEDHMQLQFRECWATYPIHEVQELAGERRTTVAGPPLPSRYATSKAANRVVVTVALVLMVMPSRTDTASLGEAQPPL